MAVTAWTYILKCADDSFYIGWTNDLPRRLAAHNAGQGAKYTRGRRPVEMVYKQEFATKNEAMAEEARLKKLTRAQKLALFKN